MTRTARATVFARTGLVGNPSDGYGGATVAVTLRNFQAQVEAQWAGRPAVGEPLIRAAVARFERECRALPQPVSIRCRSTIPREVGLGGSSAIVIATLRALAELTGTEIERERLPALALAVETEDLGIAAGLQDRVVQAYGGLVFMDFERHRHEPLEASLLAPLFVAYLPSAGTASGSVHADVRARFAAGEPRVVAAMQTLATLAHEARAALIARDHDAFAAALDAGYDMRASIFELDPRHTRMIDEARDLGLSATYTGSGGAIAGIARDRERVEELRRRLRAAGAQVVNADH